MQRIEQTCRADTECVGKLNDVEQRDIALTALDSANVVAMEVCQFGESLLRQAAFSTQLAQSSPKLDSRIVSGWHALMIGRCTL